jgi:hypothetical protein
MECLGMFQAQSFKWISADPNSIFQFLVFPDRLFLVKVGSALNQIPQVASRGLIEGPVGLKDFSRGGLPSLAQARALVAPPPKKSFFRLTPALANREIHCTHIATCWYQPNGLFSRGLHVRLRDDEKLFFRFLDPRELDLARPLLSRVLGSRFGLKSS